jgi:hypothetical protein
MSFKEDDYLLFALLLSSIKRTLNYITEKQVLEVVMRFEYGLLMMVEILILLKLLTFWGNEK